MTVVRKGEQDMATAIADLKTTLSALDRSATAGINDVIRKAGDLVAQARRITNGAEHTAPFKVMPERKVSLR